MKGVCLHIVYFAARFASDGQCVVRGVHDFQLADARTTLAVPGIHAHGDCSSKKKEVVSEKKMEPLDILAQGLPQSRQ
jgi:hypothetical protein